MLSYTLHLEGNGHLTPSAVACVLCLLVSVGLGNASASEQRAGVLLQGGPHPTRLHHPYTLEATFVILSDLS